MYWFLTFYWCILTNQSAVNWKFLSLSLSLCLLPLIISSPNDLPRFHIGLKVTAVLGCSGCQGVCVKERERERGLLLAQLADCRSGRMPLWSPIPDLWQQKQKRTIVFPLVVETVPLLMGPPTVWGHGVGQNVPSTSPSFKANQYDCWVVWLNQVQNLCGLIIWGLL